MSYLISFQYFVHRPDVASTAMDRVLINNMCLWIYCCGIATHIRWITRVSSLRFSCSGCARTLRLNRSNKWSIVFKSRLLQVIWFCACCLLHALLVCLSSRVTLCVISSQHHTEIGTDMKKKNRPNDVISIHHRSYVSLNGYTWRFRVHEHAWVCSAMLIFATFNFFHNRQSTRITFLPNSTSILSCTRSPSTWPISASNVPHGWICTWKRFFFPLIDRMVCTIQSNQTSDALIKYVAQYHILYSGLLEICLGVHCLTLK